MVMGCLATGFVDGADAGRGSTTLMPQYERKRRGLAALALRAQCPAELGHLDRRISPILASRATSVLTW